MFRLLWPAPKQIHLSTSSAEIFHNNCFKNGIWPAAVARDALDARTANASDAQNPVLTVDLEAQGITRPNGALLRFESDGFQPGCLLEGLDDIGLTMRKAGRIDAFGARRSAALR